jgi:hypothetical protein
MMRLVKPLEGVVMGGSFTSGRFRFQVEASDETSDKARGFHEELLDEAFDLRLSDTGRVPDLGGAPIASWILARLARLTDGALGLASEEFNDGGGYMVEFVVYLVHIEPEKTRAPFVQPLLFDMEELGVYIEPEKPVASFQFQGDMEGAAVLGYRTADCPEEKVLEALAAALLVAPDDLLSREIAIIDPEWELDPEMYKPEPVTDSCNWYGWDGFQFLGRDNIRDADL